MKNEEKIKLFLLVCLINLCEFSINERIFFFSSSQQENIEIKIYDY